MIVVENSIPLVSVVPSVILLLPGYGLPSSKKYNIVAHCWVIRYLPFLGVANDYISIFILRVKISKHQALRGMSTLLPFQRCYYIFDFIPFDTTTNL